MQPQRLYLKNNAEGLAKASLEMQPLGDLLFH